MKGEHARTPRSDPIVSGKMLLDHGSEIRCTEHERLPVNQERQRAVRNAAIILEIGLLGLDGLGHKVRDSGKSEPIFESHLKFQELVKNLRDLTCPSFAFLTPGEREFRTEGRKDHHDSIVVGQRAEAWPVGSASHSSPDKNGP